MENEEEEKYNAIITRMDGSKEEYAEITIDSIDFGKKFLVININANNRIKYFDVNTIKEFEVFK